MKFDIKVSNFGKIDQADIKVRPFTVIAGPNSSGKSFITKALYSIFSTINIDHVSVEAYKQIHSLERLVSFLHLKINRISRREDILFKKLFSRLALVKTSIDDAFGSNTFTNQVSSSFLLKESIDSVEKAYSSLLNEVSPKSKFQKVQDQFDNIKNLINQLKIISDAPTHYLSSGIDLGIVNALKENFQVTSIDSLKNHNSIKESEVKFDLDTLGNLSINAAGKLDFSLNQTSIDEFQKLYNVVYLESPVYWKLKNALDSVRKNKGLSAFGRRRGADILTGVPKHFYDLLDLLESKVKNNDEVRLSSEDIRNAIGGQLEISDTGDISFQENNSSNSVNLHITALGITNLGIISLLIDRNIISKGSFLFIDEPEVHLHPSWQKLMVDTLFELSKQGINIVIATHSIDMMKSIENIVNKDEELVINEHFGVNQLSEDGVTINTGKHVSKKIANIKTDLAKPFLDMFYESQLDLDI